MVPINHILKLLFIVLFSECLLSTYFVSLIFQGTKDAMVHIRAFSCSDNE